MAKAHYTLMFFLQVFFLVSFLSQPSQNSPERPLFLRGERFQISPKAGTQWCGKKVPIGYENLVS